MGPPYTPLTALPRPLAVFKGPTSKVSEGRECKGEVTGEEGRDGRQWREGGKGTHEKCEF